MADPSSEKKSGCSIFSAVFGTWPRKSPSASPVQTTNKNNANGETPSTPPTSKRRRGGSDMSTMSSQKQTDRIIARPGGDHGKVPPVPQQIQRPNMVRPTNPVGNGMVRKDNFEGYYGQARKVPYGSTGISGELESMISDHQRSKTAGMLVRASSGNVMLPGNLGNLRQGSNVSSGAGTLNHKITTSNVQKQENGKYPGSKKVKKGVEEKEKPGSLCRTLSTRIDPEELKILGNEDFKNGNYAEALALYEAAISIEPNKASYRSNKSAALAALGRLLEAVFEGREAIRIEAHYRRAHTRLATLYVRLGEAEKAIYHHKLAGDEIDPDILTKAKKLQLHLIKCTEAKKHRDFNTLIKETELAISAGADSALQIFALRAETMLKLRRHGDADETMAMGPEFDVDDCTKFFGNIGNANILIIRAQVDMAAGRFDEAVDLAQRAAKLDGTNKEVNTVVRRIRAMTLARSNGNDLFRVQKYAQACEAYGEGLDHDPFNSVLLCNRATCRSKLGHFEKAIDDCNVALSLRPSYRKARLRRADCYAKLEKWEACIQDYELLNKETPDDEEVSQALKIAHLQRNNQTSDGSSTTKQMSIVV